MKYTYFFLDVFFLIGVVQFARLSYAAYITGHHVMEFVMIAMSVTFAYIHCGINVVEDRDRRIEQ